MPLYRDGAYPYCRWLTNEAQSHFTLGLRLLPKERRQAMEVVYAFCRAVDDIVDKGASPLQAQKVPGRPDPFWELNRWRKELADCVTGCPTHPIAVALQPVIERYRIPIEHFEEVIAGVQMDLTPRRYATFEELRVYCERVASAVGRISIRVFGCEHPAAKQYATDLGIALQLTNILRDLKPDLDRDRLYLPLSELSPFGLSESNLSSQQGADSFQRMMGFQAARARGFFRRAEEALKETGEARKLLPARIMGGIYAQLLRRMEAIQYQVFSQRVSIPRRQQLWIAARTFVCTP